jgi:hypothetical protein
MELLLPIRQTDNANALFSALVSVLSKRISIFFNQWRDAILTMKMVEEKDKTAHSLSQAKDIMKNSIRGQRSMVEQEALAKILSTLSCIPKMSSLHMDLLTNNIECMDCTGRTLVFLQGDFGACFYIMATGNIELYLEPSKDKEMANCREFGVFRGSNFDLEKCGSLGRHIVTLKAGWRFMFYSLQSCFVQYNYYKIAHNIKSLALHEICCYSSTQFNRTRIRRDGDFVKHSQISRCFSSGRR